MSDRPDILSAIKLGTNSPSPDPTLASTIKLDQDSVLRLIRNAGGSPAPAAVITSRTVIVDIDYAAASYAIDPKLTSGNKAARLSLRISQGQSNDDALNQMKNDLAVYDGDITQEFQKTSSALGNCSLQTDKFIVWTNLRHYVRLSTNLTTNSPNLPITTLFQIASSINAEIVKTTGPASSLIIPKPVLAKPGPITTTQGTTMNIQLNNVSNTTGMLSADKAGIVYSLDTVANGGLFKVFLRGVGTTKVTLVVADNQYLTVGATSVEINVKVKAS